MASEHSNVEGLKRLALQLQSLSQLTETLTYRLLELDERLAASESTIAGLQREGGPSLLMADDTAVRLEDTEARLARLETILSDDQVSWGRRLELVAASAPQEQSGLRIEALMEDSESQLFCDEAAAESEEPESSQDPESSPEPECSQDTELFQDFALSQEPEPFQDSESWQDAESFQAYDGSQELEPSDANGPLGEHGDDEFEQMDHFDQAEDRLIA